MLFQFTALTEFVGAAICLWLAMYLLARSASRTTLRAVVALFALAAAMLCSYANLYEPAPGLMGWWAALFTVGLICWYSFTQALLPAFLQKKLRGLEWGLYFFSAVKIIALITLQYGATTTNSLVITPLRATWYGLADIAFMITTASALLYNFWVGARYGVGLNSRHIWAASALGLASVVYGMLAVLVAGLPRLGQVGLIVLAVLVLSYAVAARQSLIEQRTTLQDFPISMLMMAGLIALYTVAGRELNLPPVTLAFTMALTILTHSAHDLVRQFLDRILYRRYSVMRQQLRQLAHEVGGQDLLPGQLQRSLVGLCEALNASGGFIAVKRGEALTVEASLHSLPVHRPVAALELQDEDVYAPLPSARAPRVAWLAPARFGPELLGLIGLGPRLNNAKYADNDLDLLADMAEWVGKMIHAQTEEDQRRQTLLQLVAETQSPATAEPPPAAEALAQRGEEPSVEFVRLVENGLRNLADYTALGPSPLATHLENGNQSHIERGKAVRAKLIEAIESLKPGPARPSGIPPREWHNYIILHDAYIADVPNREIMARLYISEGTFNRQRRRALQAVARVLQETHPLSLALPA